MRVRGRRAARVRLVRVRATRARRATQRDVRVSERSRQRRGLVVRVASPHAGHALCGGMGRARAGPVEGGVVPFVAAAALAAMIESARADMSIRVRDMGSGSSLARYVSI